MCEDYDEDIVLYKKLIEEKKHLQDAEKEIKSKICKIDALIKNQRILWSSITKIGDKYIVKYHNARFNHFYTYKEAYKYFNECYIRRNHRDFKRGVI